MSALEEAIKCSRDLKIDECEVVSVNRKVTTIRITDSEIFELKQNFEESFGIRIIHGKRIASIQTSARDFTKSIESCLKRISQLKPTKLWKSLPFELKNKKNLDGVYDKKLEEISGSMAADLGQSMINSALNHKIKAISGSLNIVSEIFEIKNSNGLSLRDKGTYISGIINADSTVQPEVSGLGHGCCRTLDKFFPEKIGEDAKTMCLESINPKKPEPGKYSIIFEPYSVGEILAFVAAPNFNFKTWKEKKSCFSNRINENIAVEEFSLIDNPHISQGIGSKSFDDEGMPTRVNTLIKKGEFVNTYSDLFDSFKEDTKSSGNASRHGMPMGRSSEPIPMSSPHNLEIQEGKVSREEMIKETRHGLIIGRLWYTYAVNPIKGDFSCTARSGIKIINNGRIINPGKSVRIIHNLQNLLKNISAVGNDKKNVIQWASLPSIVPSIKVEQIDVNPI